MLYNCQVTLYYHTPDGRPGRGKSFFTTPKEQLDALNLPTPSRHRTQGKGDRGIQFRWHINDLGAIVRHNILAVMNARAVGEMQESLQRFGIQRITYEESEIHVQHTADPEDAPAPPSKRPRLVPPHPGTPPALAEASAPLAFALVPAGTPLPDTLEMMQERIRIQDADRVAGMALIAALRAERDAHRVRSEAALTRLSAERIELRARVSAMEWQMRRWTLKKEVLEKAVSSLQEEKEEMQRAVEEAQGQVREAVEQSEEIDGMEEEMDAVRSQMDEEVKRREEAEERARLAEERVKEEKRETEQAVNALVGI